LTAVRVPSPHHAEGGRPHGQVHREDVCGILLC